MVPSAAAVAPVVGDLAVAPVFGGVNTLVAERSRLPPDLECHSWVSFPLTFLDLRVGSQEVPLRSALLAAAPLLAAAALLAAAVLPSQTTEEAHSPFSRLGSQPYSQACLHA